VNTRFVETFVTLAHLRSFRATARALHATPAAISLRLKNLEEELCTQLIDRNAKEFRLTADGEYLLGYAKAVVEAARRLRAAALGEDAAHGRLRLGVNETVVHSWLADYVRQLNADYPQIDLDLTVDTSTVLQKRLLDGELDLVVRVEGIDNSAIVSDALANYPVRWIARRDLFGPRKNRLIERVLERPVLSFGRGTAPYRALEDIVANLASVHGLPAGQARITGSPSVAAIVKLVKDGYGVAAIPGLFVMAELASEEFVELPIPVPPSIVLSMCRHAEAEKVVHAAVNAARLACAKYCSTMDPHWIEALC
jgi:DNA-binding transcriptional LysR family regulator